ncbi:AAA-domain-containing protein [Rhodofomes roseus]|uniref:Peroxisomal ATPase PEX1 n=1 Tax=Rhodofomes roseus TaxID=34475 RepID=A0ABQ8KQG8_9APHY|nr:AAA-domain-containing protein [Rhodofomes roseus]KAH9840780.1 AAA-domain-containing protein [Rhodofomes roseus]
MPRRARIHFVSLHSSLVNLPISIYGPLLERGIRPQGLAVHLTWVPRDSQDGVDSAKRKLEAYVGWTGMASASSLAHFNSAGSSDKSLETIEMDPQFAQGLGFVAGDIVEIGLLHDLGLAKSVATEPVTSDDWEIIELHASHVESTLLSQVRVAAIGQEIDIWVLGRTRVRLRVVSLEPSTAGKALLLTTSTEVSIAPKLHSRQNGSAGPAVNGKTKQKKHRGANGKVNGVSTPAEDLSGSIPNGEAAKLPVRVMRVLPHRLVPSSPTTSHRLPDADVVIAYVSRAALTSLAEASGSASNPSPWRARVRRLPPPSDPSQEQNSGGPASPPAPRVLVPNGEASAAKAPSQPPEKARDEVVLVWSPEVPVPEGHVVISGQIENVEDWDMVRVAFVGPEATPLSDVDRSVEHRPYTSIPPSKHGLAGVDDILDKATGFCRTNFLVHSFGSRVRGVPGLLVTGRSGAGKTSLLNAIAKSMQEDPQIFAYVLHVDMSKYTETTVGKMRALLRYWIAKATWHRPCVLVVDNIDKLMSAELEHADSFRSRHITELFLSTFGPSSRTAAPNASGIVLLAAAESQTALHPSLNSSHLFQEVVSLKPPGKDARRDIISQLVRERIDTSNIVEDSSKPVNFTALATQTEGYSVTDLKDFVARAVHQAAIRCSENGEGEEASTTLIPEDFATAQVDFVPHSLRDVKLQRSEVEWADIGGLNETKRTLRETLEWPTKYGPIFAQSPLRLRSGLLLYGYPGCGKTLLASAVAKECGLNFISIKGPELLNKYIGASEKSVRDLFERASAAKPCVLFFDEFDSIAPKRGHDSTGVTDRVVNQMLTQMDGAEGLDGVYVLAATSRPDLIDSALLRPGRLDKSLLCDMPDVNERREILEALGRKINIAPSVDLQAVARETDGFSGADLQALVYNAHLEVIHEAIPGPSSTADPVVDGVNDREHDVQYSLLGEASPESQQVLSIAEESAFQRRLQRILREPPTRQDAESDKIARSKPTYEISDTHVRRVLGTTRPSVPDEERDRLSRIYRAFVSDRSGELPVPPEGTEVGSRVSLM